MVKVEYLSDKNMKYTVPQELLQGKRHLTPEEIKILEDNLNHNSDATWENFYVDAEEGAFDPNLIHFSFFSGFIVLGKLRKAILRYNDLHLTCGIRRSRISDAVIGDDVVIRNISFMDNYRIGNRVILFNIQELCCTKHSKFGNGILKEGEPEEHRVWIGVANENDGRSILPFEDMIPADAYLWSHYRDSPKLLEAFKKMTEYGNDRKLNTFGYVDDDAVVKNSSIIKDAKIGKSAYIKGALKLKNITILSSEEEPSQVGEGVEMVNGILGYGSKIFYQAIAIRFVIGRNCQVKYGARLLNSVLGDNSTISCCEVLNNLIFPFHEQHHNSSFLIATTIQGQSNIASGSTIGSNHNSRSPDGEIFAKRGFWPGLCSDFKHNSRFASFTLVAKGSYPNELDISYPFSLVSPPTNTDHTITIIPAWWLLYDMFAIARNMTKFTKRDKRKVKVQYIETDPFAPDTMQEAVAAIDRIITLTSEYLYESKNEYVEEVKTKAQLLLRTKDFLHQNPEADFTLFDSQCQKKYGAVIKKPVAAYKMYRKLIKYFSARTLVQFCKAQGQKQLSEELILKIRELPLYTKWENVGGQIMPQQLIEELFAKIKKSEIKTWKEVHEYYNKVQENYDNYKTRYALFLLERLYSRPIEDFSTDLFRNITDDVSVFAFDFYNSAFSSRKKDYTDYYRNMTYRNEKEKEAVIGNINDNDFLKSLRKDTAIFVDEMHSVFRGLIK